MSAKKIHHGLPQNKLSHAKYVAAWRVLTGKKYKDSPASLKRKRAKAKLKRRYDHPGRPRTGDMGKLPAEPNERPRYPRTCGVRAVGKSGRNQQTEPNVKIDTSSWSLAALDAKLAAIDNRFRVDLGES